MIAAMARPHHPMRGVAASPARSSAVRRSSRRRARRIIVVTARGYAEVRAGTASQVAARTVSAEAGRSDTGGYGGPTVLTSAGTTTSSPLSSIGDPVAPAATAVQCSR